MRLLNTETLKLETFYDSNIPVYAILSHTWNREEVLFQDIENGIAHQRYGHAKLVGAVRQAVKDGFKYIWIDTCCIDKSSSAELSEAINSMFRWYREAQVCYAFLSDVTSDIYENAFRWSRWFTRGWTLQELIAPPVVYFFASNWQEIGSRNDMVDLIVEITGIPSNYFSSGDLSLFSVAQKMSWAANRTTSRIEDTAYCLLGIFDINMPLLYGEGNRAFQRLQEEILQHTEDDSIFYHESSHVLAETPVAFKQSGDITVKSSPYDAWCQARIRSRGIRINRKRVEMSFLIGEETRDEDGRRSLLALLDCSIGNHTSNRPSLLLALTEVSPGNFARPSGLSEWQRDKTTASRLLMKNARELTLTLTRNAVHVHSRWGDKAAALKNTTNLIARLRRMPLSGLPLGSQPQREQIAEVRRTGTRHGAPLNSDYRTLNDNANTVIVKGPVQIYGRFTIVDVHLPSAFLSQWVLAGDEVHLYPTGSGDSDWARAHLIYSNQLGKSFMLVVNPKETSMRTHIYTNIPSCDGRNLMAFIEEVERTDLAVSSVMSCRCRRMDCIHCPRQMLDDKIPCVISVSTRKRAEGWLVSLSVRS